MAFQPLNIGAADGKNGDNLFTGAGKINGNFTENYNSIALLSATNIGNRVVVNQSNKDQTIGGMIDSTKMYFIDGIVDMGSTQVTVPPTGISLRGDSSAVSGLISSEDNYTMFISESIAIGSGRVSGSDYLISTTGVNSKVYELYDATGFNSIEVQRVNYSNCSSLGDLYNYGQGLEVETSRLGGKPSLTLHGLWRSGFRVTTSIVRSLDTSMIEPLFKAGAAFQMNSRFLTDINCDLPPLAAFMDFSVVNFPNESTIQFKGAVMTRAGIPNSSDPNITPNLSSSDLPCDWVGNIGMESTHVGGMSTNTVESTTTISSIGVAVSMAGTWDVSDLQHYDSPTSNELRHLGSDPKAFRVDFSFVVEGPANNTLSIELIKDDGSTLTTSFSQTRVVNNLQGGRDVAYFTGSFNVTVNKNDSVVWNVSNLSGTGNVTVEVDSSWSIGER